MKFGEHSKNSSVPESCKDFLTVETFNSSGHYAAETFWMENTTDNICGAVCGCTPDVNLLITRLWGKDDEQITTIFGFLDRCTDQTYLIGELQAEIVKVQLGEKEIPEFHKLNCDELLNSLPKIEHSNKWNNNSNNLIYDVGEGPNKVAISVACYEDNATLAVEVDSLSESEILTQNNSINLPPYYAVINDYDIFKEFLEVNGLAVKTSFLVERLFDTVPVYAFNRDRLMSLDLAGCISYEEANGYVFPSVGK